MARKRDRYKEYARDAAQRRVEGLRKALSETRWNESSRQNIENRIKQLENAIYESRTYADGKRIAGHTQESTLAAAKMLRSLVEETPIQRQVKKLESFDKPSVAARNRMFTTMLNMASSGSDVTVTIGRKSFTLTENMARAFYRTYQDLWNTGNVAVNERNARILTKSGIRSLEEAFAVAMGIGNNYQRIQLLDKVQDSVPLTDDEAIELYAMLSEGQNNASYKRGHSGSIAANVTQIEATREVGSSDFAYVARLTSDERLSAIRNFLGEDFEWSDIY